MFKAFWSHGHAGHAVFGFIVGIANVSATGLILNLLWVLPLWLGFLYRSFQGVRTANRQAIEECITDVLVVMVATSAIGFVCSHAWAGC